MCLAYKYLELGKYFNKERGHHMHSISLSTGTTKTKALVINALFIALTLVATMFINIRLPIMGNGGLIHLGNVPLFVAALVFGRKQDPLQALSEWPYSM